MVEAAQCSAKKKKWLPGDESGNMLIVTSIILLIVGAIGYFLSVSDKVDKEVRSLGATQKTVYLKPDVQETIRKTLMGNNPDCNATTNPVIYTALKTAFMDFSTTLDNAKYVYSWKLTTSGGTTLTSVSDARCFFHPSRYTGIEFQNVTINMVRASEPNFITLSSFVTASINIGFKSAGKISQLKYSLRYRVDVLSLNHFGLIFYNSPQLFSQPDASSVRIHSWVLVDQPNRSQKINMTKFLDNGDFEKLKFYKNFWMAAPGLSTDAYSLTFLKDKRLSNTFAYGIEFGVLPTAASFKAPYEKKPTEWDDTFNYDYTLTGYPLPKLSGPVAVIKKPTEPTPTMRYDLFEDGTPFNSSKSFNTADIYASMYSSKADVFQSCAPAMTDAGQVNVLIFNNLGADFTIDFTGNTATGTPPIFCGFVAARNLTIKLNDSTDPAVKLHHLIGKFIINGTINVVNKGELHFHDIMSVSVDDINYGIADLENVRTQYYNWKFYSTQNFQLPFFQNDSFYGSSAPNDLFFQPRATKSFFNKDCSPYKCRDDDINVPTDTMIIDDHKNDLLYEVFSVE